MEHYQSRVLIRNFAKCRKMLFFPFAAANRADDGYFFLSVAFTTKSSIIEKTSTWLVVVYWHGTNQIIHDLLGSLHRADQGGGWLEDGNERFANNLLLLLTKLLLSSLFRLAMICTVPLVALALAAAAACSRSHNKACLEPWRDEPHAPPINLHLLTHAASSFKIVPIQYYTSLLVAIIPPIACLYPLNAAIAVALSQYLLTLGVSRAIYSP